MSAQFRYRYYSGEPECPFDKAKDFSRYVFWHEEKFHAALSLNERERFVGMLEEAVRRGDVHGRLTDSALPIEDRSVEFYAELHCGKFDPYGFASVDWPSYFASSLVRNELTEKM